MKHLLALLAFVLLQSTAWLSPAQAMVNYNTPTAVTGALYDTAYQHFGFRPDTLMWTQNYLSPKLSGRLWSKVYLPTSSQKDVFFCSDTRPADYRVAKEEISGDKARVDVKLTWLGPGGPKTDVWVMLKKINGAWKVDDVDYGIFGKLSNYL
jgi:hypothetical protein